MTRGENGVDKIGIKLRRKAQVSMEYLMIVGFVVIIAVPMLLIFYAYADSTEDQIISNQIQKIGLKISDSAEAMYYLGEPSRTRIRAFFPKNINSISVGSNEVTFIVRTKDGIDHVVIYSSVPVQGTLDPHEGYHNINIISRGTYVEITD